MAVLGPGPIGLLCARLCCLAGASYVALTAHRSRTPAQKARIALAEKMGCSRVAVTGEEEEWEKKILADCPGGVDKVIVTSPPKSIQEGLRIIRYGGSIIFLGLSFKPGENIIPFDVNHAVFNKITLKPSFAEPALNFPAALELLRSGKVPAELFQTHTLDFDNCREIFGQVLAGDLSVIKPIFLPGGAFNPV